MLLTHQELTLRTACAADAPRLTAWWNDGAVMAHAGFPLGLDTTEQQTLALLRLNRAGVREQLIAECGGRPIGELYYRSILAAEGAAPVPPTAEIGIKLCEADSRDKGYGKLLLSLLIRELFRMGFTAIVLDTNPDNARARQVYHRLGFVQAGLILNNWRDQLGQLQSTVYYRLEPEQFRDFAL